jgi:Uncharacterized protein conserved in bacteria
LKARIKFRKYGVMRFIGHLDVMRFFQKAIRRAEIPIAFTSGYSPHMIMSFAQPLGVGVTSDGEYFDIELTEAIASEQAVAQLNAVMVEGIEVTGFREISSDKKASGMTIVAAADYKVTQPQTFQHAEDIRVLSAKWKDSVCAFMKEPQIIVWKKTKRSEKEVDIKPMIYDMHAEDDGIFLFLATGSEQNLKPDLVMEAFLRFIGENPEEVPLHFHRLEVYAKNPESAGGTTKNDFVSLEDLGKDIVTT